MHEDAGCLFFTPLQNTAKNFALGKRMKKTLIFMSANDNCLCGDYLEIVDCFLKNMIDEQSAR